jgi:hypothetical protein
MAKPAPIKPVAQRKTNKAGKYLTGMICICFETIYSAYPCCRAAPSVKRLPITFGFAMKHE